MLLKDRLIQLLNTTTGEREIHNFLKEEPFLISSTFMRSGGHSEYVIPEFSFSGKHRADFVVMQAFSGGWNIAFVELEPVDIKPFLKKGRQSERLRGAVKQIDDWKNFERRQPSSLRSSLADAAQREDLLYPERNLGREPQCPKMPLRDPRTYLCCDYYIVMGRRSHFSEELLLQKAEFYPNHNIHILTYDRLIEVAENLTRQNNLYRERIIDPRDKDFMTQFALHPEKFTLSTSEKLRKYPSEIDVHGTTYKVQPHSGEPGFVVDILNVRYEIFEDRQRFSISRIDGDSFSLPVADNLESLKSAIEMAEIFERFICFHENENNSLDLVEGCLIYLMGLLDYDSRND